MLSAFKFSKETFSAIAAFNIRTSMLVDFNFLLKFIIESSNNGYKKQTIIRTSVGSQRPLHPQHQHISDFTDQVRKMCTNIEVIKLKDPSKIFPSYKKALNRQDGRSTLLVEFGDYYNEKQYNKNNLNI